MRNFRSLVVGACVGIAAATQANAETRWTYYSTSPITHDFGKAIAAAMDAVKERTNGELSIEFINYAETPYTSNSALEIVRDGLAEMTEWIPAYASGTYPVLGAPGLPFLPGELPDTIQAQALADTIWTSGDMGKAVDDILAAHGARELGSYYYEPMNFFFNGPVNGPADMAGKRIRVFSPETALLVEKIGGVPISMPAAEVYGALQRGGLDGVITSIGTVPGLKWSEQLNSMYGVNMAMIKTAILIRQEALDSLDEGPRAILEEEMKKLDQQFRTGLAASQQKHEETLKQMNFTFVSSAGEGYASLRNLTETEVWPAWRAKAGADGNAALDSILEVAR